MSGKQHFWVAMFLLVVAAIVSVSTPALRELLAAVGAVKLLFAAVIYLTYALIPDIDIDSNIQTIIYALLFLLESWLVGTKQYFTVGVVGALAMIPIIAKHRGLCHSWAFGLVISLPLAILHWTFAVAAFIGFALHKLCDIHD